MTSTSFITVGLDIGSNTISCCMLEALPGGFSRVIKDISLPVRLSEGLEEGGPLRKEAIMRALLALERLYGDFEMDKYRVRAAGTAVLRLTSNPESFLEPAEDILGRPVEVISGEMEAELTRVGATMDLKSDGDVAVLDIGGQSTELSRLAGEGSLDAVSMPFGVVALKERFMDSPKPGPDDLARARAFVDEAIRKSVPEGAGGQLVCVGGTPTTLSLLEHNLKGWNRDRVHGDRISLEAAKLWLDRMCALTPEERRDKHFMRPRRADVFPAGLLTLIAVMERLGVDEFIVSANGLRVGLARSVL